MQAVAQKIQQGRAHVQVKIVALTVYYEPHG
jgi:hypothetical protein